MTMLQVMATEVENAIKKVQAVGQTVSYPSFAAETDPRPDPRPPVRQQCE